MNSGQEGEAGEGGGTVRQGRPRHLGWSQGGSEGVQPSPHASAASLGEIIAAGNKVLFALFANGFKCLQQELKGG